jgi:hypothetical protein
MNHQDLIDSGAISDGFSFPSLVTKQNQYLPLFRPTS